MLVLAAISDFPGPLVVTYANADTRSERLNEAIVDFCSGRKHAVAAKSLGTAAYFGLMRISAAMVGNSSSGLIEAPSFGLPVVNVGDRQRGRLRARNVMDAPPERRAIRAALQTALSAAFKEQLRGMHNPYGEGTAARTIVGTLESFQLDSGLVMKKFHDATQID